ncbi:MAG: Ig-like domain repeat protein [Bryobacteraceae bacterium]
MRVNCHAKGFLVPLAVLTISPLIPRYTAAQGAPNEQRATQSRKPSPSAYADAAPNRPSQDSSMDTRAFRSKDGAPSAKGARGRSPNGVPLFLPAYDVYNTNLGYVGGESSIALGDLNGDGIPDLVFANGAVFICNGVGVLLGNGDGTFREPICYSPGSTGAAAISIADMNGDGIPDLIAASPCDSSNNCATGNIGVLLGNGDGTFQPVIGNTNGIAGAGLVTLAVADVNNDGHPDAVAFNGSSGTVLVLFGNGDGTLQSPVSYNPPYGDPPGLATGNMGGGGLDGTILTDINGDGILDIVLLSFCVANDDCSSGLVGYLLGNGDGTFQSSSTSQPLLGNTFRTQAYLTNGMAVADVNGDGVPDIVTASSGPDYEDGVASVLIGLGGGAFLPAATYDSGGTGGLSPGVADVNGDGIPDLIVLNQSCPVPMNCSDSSSVGILLGNGDGTFQAAQSYTSGTYAQGPMIIADVNRDGVLDLVANANQDFIMLGTLGRIIPTVTSVATTPNPSLFGQTVTLTASVTPKGPSPPTGTVTFNDGGNSLGTGQMSGGMASLSTSALVLGTNSITASYSGDASYGASTSTPVSQVVHVSPSATSLASSVNPSLSGEPVVFTATVTSSSGGTPAGKVVFKNGATAFGTAALTAGAAQYTTAKLPLGSSGITAVYEGDGNYRGSASTPLIQVVINRTTTTLASAPNPSSYGQAIEFTATVNSSGGAPPDGEMVTFMQGSTVLGTGTLSGGVAALSTSGLGAGTEAVVAVYGGDANFGTSTSKPVKQVVSRATSAITLTSSPNPSEFGKPVTFDAAVAPQFSGTPTGTVVFKDGTTTLKNVTLNGGTASFTASGLTAGSHTITATYNGSVDFVGSTETLTQTVE